MIRYKINIKGVEIEGECESKLLYHELIKLHESILAMHDYCAKKTRPVCSYDNT